MYVIICQLLFKIKNTYIIRFNNAIRIIFTKHGILTSFENNMCLFKLELRLTVIGYSKSQSIQDIIDVDKFASCA